ncbi:MAG: hypothetical protein FJX59_17310 [Alphaproteobacteria bacterium]|nr:hypothetical protein [Alphaproteobacteria bacterium]
MSTAAALLITLAFAFPYVFRKQDPVINGERVTECDRLAAHPSDSQKLSPGIPQEQVDIPRARAACLRAVGERPDNGRLLYQLGRTFFYDRQLEAGINYFEKSAATGYPQGQFVLGLILTQGNGTEPDECRAGELWLAAARQRHLYSKVYFTQNWLDRLFADCRLETTEQEIDGFVSSAEELADTATQKDDVAQMKKNWTTRKK